MESSPLMEFCAAMDARYPESPHNYLYQNIALKIDRFAFTQRFLDEIKFRKDNGLNFLVTTEGEQGQGKSLFDVELSVRIGIVYEFPFVLDRDIFVNPMDLDFELRKEGDARRTFMRDEMPKRKAGIGSGTADISLKDWENVARYTQKNILKCAPEFLEDEAYFIFRQCDYWIARVKNEKCQKCVLFSQCRAKPYSTLCDEGKAPYKIKFWQREGYPKNFSFMLYTKRLMDKLFVPRGVVSLPMVLPKIALEYDAVKRHNIAAFEKFESGLWQKKISEMDQFISTQWDNLTKKKGRSLLPQSHAVIEGWFYTVFGTQKYTRDEVRIFLGLIRQRIIQKCDEDNQEILR